MSNNDAFAITRLRFRANLYKNIYNIIRRIMMYVLL